MLLFQPRDILAQIEKSEERGIMFDSWESTVAVIVAILIAYTVVLWVGTIVWTYRDIRERTHDGWTQTVSLLMVLVFNIPGLMLYLILRPHETMIETNERRLEAEALLRDMPEPRPTCPGCQRGIKDFFIVCPQCRTKLRQPCPSCDRPLDLAWTACPYCATLTDNAQASPASSVQGTTPTDASSSTEPPSEPPSSGFPPELAAPSPAEK